VCEPLHGHNYHIYAEIHGPLDENHYVIDFIAVRDALQRIVDSLDHRMLLPTEHPTIQVAEQHQGETSEVVAQHGERRWTFPRADCVLLPVANTTAELLAKYIADELLEGFGEAERQSIGALEVGVDECDGQWGVYRWTPTETSSTCDR
jgi:6-pyruvoyltetrahydropterin/6-carboxytetrahydropterin synthase